jgi:hypothetical protein
MSIYCTYLTIYRGSKLPMFYIGSTSIQRIENGYHGSVSSRKYKKLWDRELKQNPHLFETKIITTHFSDIEARKKELQFQRQLKVVKSSLYINESEARIHGFFGRNVAGKNNPMYGKTKEQNPNFGSKRSKETKALMSTSNSRPMSEQQKKKLSIINTGKTYSKEYKTNMSLIKTGVKQPKIQCPHCGKAGGQSGMKRYHFDKCSSIKRIILGKVY